MVNKLSNDKSPGYVEKDARCIVPDCDLPICERCGFCRRAHNKKGIGISQVNGVFCEGFVCPNPHPPVIDTAQEVQDDICKQHCGEMGLTGFHSLLCVKAARLPHPGGELGDACGECGLPLRAHPGRLCDKFVSNAAVVKGECMWNPPSECPACNPKPEAAPALGKLNPPPLYDEVYFDAVAKIEEMNGGPSVPAPAEAIPDWINNPCPTCGSAGGELCENEFGNATCMERVLMAKAESPQAEANKKCVTNGNYCKTHDCFSATCKEFGLGESPQAEGVLEANKPWTICPNCNAGFDPTWNQNSAQSQPSSLAGFEAWWAEYNKYINYDSEIESIAHLAWNAARQQSQPIAGSGDDAAHHFEQGWRKGFEEGRKQSQPVIEPLVSDYDLEHQPGLYPQLIQRELQQFRKAQKDLGK